MLTEDERVEYRDLEEGRWTMSGYGPGSEKAERLESLRNKKWDEVGLKELFRDGDVEVGKFNRKDPYEDIGYQGHFNVEFDDDSWETSMIYRPFFELDYEDQVLKINARDSTQTVEQGEEVLEIRSSEDLQEEVENHLCS